MSRHPYTDITERVAKDLAEHEMAVLHDDGLYRHIRFKKPGTRSYYFDLVTWPGILAHNGDMGSWTFSRIEDMFNFFTEPYINPGYWGEKLRASSSFMKFSEEMLEQTVREHLENHSSVQEMGEDERKELWDRIEWDVLGAGTSEQAHAALTEFHYGNFEFVDTWEWDFEDYTYQFLWACAAIQWGIAKYREGT